MRPLPTFSQFTAILLLAFGILFAPTARAQDDAALARTGYFTRDRNISVADRPHPEFAVDPLRLGGFLLEPDVAETIAFNDNIDATPDHPTADAILRTTPALQLQSDWGLHQLSAAARVSDNRYVQHGREDTTDWALGTAGRFDAAADLGFAGGLDYSRNTEARSSSSAPQTAIRPIRYNDAEAFLKGTRAFNRLRITARGGYQDLSFDDAMDGNGNDLVQRDRDRGVATLGLRTEYAFSPAVSIFFNAEGNDRQFRNQLPAEVPRNSTGYKGEIGANFDVTHLIRGELAGGYLSQDYQHKVYGQVEGPAIRARVEYFMTSLMTATMTASRGVEDADIIGAGGYLTTQASFQLDHELLRNVVLTARVDYADDSYHGIDRDDQRGSVSLGGRYQMSRHLGIDLIYAYETRRSTGVQRGDDFSANSVVATLTVQL